MSNEMKTAVRLSLEDQFSDGIKDAGENVKDFSDDTKKSVKDVDKGLEGASKTTKKFGENAHNVGKKAESAFKVAGSAVRNFTDGAKEAAGVVNKAFSGTGAALATLGVSFSVGSAVNEVIKFDDKLTRIGLTADASAEQVKNLKNEIFDAALNSDIKVDTTSIADALDVVMTKTGDLAYSEANIKNIATAIKATGESGEAIGSVFAEFQKFGYTAEQITALMDDMVKQGDQGAFTFGEFAKAGSAVISAYSPIGTAPEDIKRANAAMQIIMKGTKSADIAVTALGSSMAELSSPDKQEKLQALGIKVRDSAGNFRDFNDIMADCINLSKKVGNTDFLGTIFGQTSMQAIRAYGNFYEDMYPKLMNLGDTSGAMQAKASTMASTLQSNLANLQTAFTRFADTNLTKPIEKFTELLNTLAENKATYQSIFISLASLAAAVGTIKVASSVQSFVSDFLKLKSGGEASLNIGSSVGSAGMPVYVTNWGGQAGSASSSNAVAASAIPQQAGANVATSKMSKMGTAVKSAATSTGIKAGGAAAVFAALEAIPQAAIEWKVANSNDELSKKEKNKAKGGAVGAAVGKIGGAAAGTWGGMVAGAAIGSVVPVIGTAFGGLIGAGAGAVAGYFAGKGGRILGEKIGEKITKEDNETPTVEMQRQTGSARFDELPEKDLLLNRDAVEMPAPQEIVNNYTSKEKQYTGATAELSGAADVNVHFTLDDKRTTVAAETSKNTARHINVNVGSVFDARESL